MPDFVEVVGIGSVYQYGNGGDDGADFQAPVDDASWHTIGQVTDIKLPEDEVSDIKTTSFDTTDGVHTYVGGLVEPGTSEIKCQYSAAKMNELRSIRKLSKRFRVFFGDSETGIGWNGFGKSTTEELDMDGITIITHKTKVSGDLVEIGVGS